MDVPPFVVGRAKARGRASAFSCFVVALALSSMSCASAAVYKCAAPGRKDVVYQDSPCAQGLELANFDKDPPSLSIVPGFGASSRTVSGANAKAASPRQAAKSDRKPRERSGDAAERRHVGAGMSEAEVVKRIGRPDMTTGGRGKEGRRWIYLPVDGDKQTVTTVTLKNGVVADVDRKVVY